jgi:hypothetical protein
MVQVCHKCFKLLVCFDQEMYLSLYVQLRVWNVFFGMVWECLEIIKYYFLCKTLKYINLFMLLNFLINNYPENKLDDQKCRNSSIEIEAELVIQIKINFNSQYLIYSVQPPKVNLPIYL